LPARKGSGVGVARHVPASPASILAVRALSGDRRPARRDVFFDIPVPTSKEQCNGGWQAFGAVFKNQSGALPSSSAAPEPR
jgi:hypothetical protein